MIVKLKVLHGQLKSKQGDSAGLEVEITRSRFVIGSATDCQMRCPSSSISEHHCEISVLDGQASIRDLGSQSGTYLNEQRIEEPRSLQTGDVLRVGRLEFEVVLQIPSPKKQKSNEVDDFVSDLLSEADAEERATRMADPRLRQYHLEAGKEEAPPPAEPKEEDRMAALRKKLPQKKPPGKLPPPPAITADTTVAAAEETLKKILDPPKKGKK